MDLPPANPDDPGRQPIITGLTWALTSLCIIVVAGRVYAGQIAFQVCLTKSLQWGLGKHDNDLSFTQLVNVTKYVWLSTIPGLLGTLFARASIAVLLVRLFGKKRWLKWYLILWTIFESLATITLLIVIFVQCSPVEGLWDPSIPARRWNPNIELYLAFFSQCNCDISLSKPTLTFSDVTFVLFPVLTIWKLNMPKRRKIALSALLSLSLLTATASILKTVTAETSQGVQNAEYTASLGALWSSIEQSFVIIMGSIPPLRPLATTQWPRLRLLGRRLTVLVTGTATNSPERDQSRLNSSDPHPRYYNLEEMNSRKISHSPANQSDTYSFRQGPTIEHVRGSDSSLDQGNHIRRTDHFSVEYSSYLRPGQAI